MSEAAGLVPFNANRGKNEVRTLIRRAKAQKKQKRRITMPVFGSPFSGLANDRKLTDKELIRAIRFMVAAEYEATQLYMQLAESTNNKLAVEVLKEIADEELVHVGEFLRLLHELAPDEEKFYAKGAKEVEEKIKKKK
jgi:demethoxyubiquinone hydroxylase (CLK1/Coq7/Cat5 family)